jgi:carboxyl-terminal processing protease
MGTQSFGKGSVQIVIPLGNQGAMRLTTARYYTPSGTSIQARGVTPDIVVPQARLEEIQRSNRLRERDLRGALDAERQRGERPSQDQQDEERPDQSEQEQDQQQNGDGQQEDGEQEGERQAEAQTQDYQLLRAIDLLKALSLVRARQEGAQ